MDRRRFLKVSGGLVAVATACHAGGDNESTEQTPPQHPVAGQGAAATAPAPQAAEASPEASKSNQETKTTLPHRDSATTMPLLFVGHGSPINALEPNKWAQGWTNLGLSLPHPNAILAVSAHWYVPKTAVTGQTRPRTIHDFYGFPAELYNMEYPAPGQPELARSIVEMLGSTAAVSLDWGLDHGTWTVLRRLFPQADIPVVQLSIHADLMPAQHIDLGRRLERLRHEGVLIVGSGNITHNLQFAMQAMQSGKTATTPWADSFDTDIAKALGQHDLTFLSKALFSDNGRISHPTPDHYLPLLYPAGASLNSDKITFPLEGMDMGTLSMRTVLWES